LFLLLCCGCAVKVMLVRVLVLVLGWWAVVGMPVWREGRVCRWAVVM
jgi:hypothetical protein